MNKTYQLPCVTLDSYYFQQKGKSKNLIEENSNKQDVDILKNEISSVKRHVWRNAVKFTNPYESVCKNYNMKISRAYFKLIEILVDFDLLFQDLDHLNTLHLCEGPGGFIEAIKDVRNKQNKHLNWKGITLKNENNDPNLPDFVNSIDKENITYTKEDLGQVIITHYPDIRKILNTLQGSLKDNKLVLDTKSLKNTDFENKVVKGLKNKIPLKDIRQIIADSGATQFESLFRCLYDNVEEYTINIGDAIIIIAQYQYDYGFVVDKEICIAAMLN